MKRPLRVLFVQSTTEKGGIETLLLTLLGALDRGRTESTVVSLDFHQGPLAEEIRALGIPVVVLHAGRLRQFFRTVWTILRLTRLARQFDVVVSNSVHAHLYGGPAARLARRPVVLVLHQILQCPAGANDTITALAVRISATRVVANSQAIAENAQRLFGASHVAVILNAIDVDQYARSRDPRTRASLGLREDEKVVAAVARLQPWKGQRTFLKAAARLKGRARFLIVGGALFGMDDDYPGELRTLAASLGLEKDVFFLGNRSDLRDIYPACDVVVLPSEEPEPFGLVLVEAMAAGTAVIGTRAGGAPEVIGQAGLLVPPKDDAALAQAIEELLTDDPRRQALAAAGQVRASERFNAPRMAAEWTALLESCCSVS